MILSIILDMETVRRLWLKNDLVAISGRNLVADFLRHLCLSHVRIHVRMIMSMMMSSPMAFPNFIPSENATVSSKLETRKKSS